MDNNKSKIHEVQEALGPDRAGRLQAQRPGCIEAGLEQAVREARSEAEIVPLAIIRALQIAGSCPTPGDLEAWKNSSEI